VTGSQILEVVRAVSEGCPWGRRAHSRPAARRPPRIQSGTSTAHFHRGQQQAVLVTGARSWTLQPGVASRELELCRGTALLPTHLPVPVVTGASAGQRSIDRAAFRRVAIRRDLILGSTQNDSVVGCPSRWAVQLSVAMCLLRTWSRWWKP